MLAVGAYEADLVNYVAAAMRKADGDHTMGTGQLAEIAVDAVLRYQDNKQKQLNRERLARIDVDDDIDVR